MRVNTYIFQFIPIFLLLFYGFYENIFIKTFRSVLGKIGVLFILIFYSAYNKLLGAVICLLVILFYQRTDTFIETMVSAPAPAPEPVQKPTQKPKQEQKPALVLEPPTTLHSRDLPPPIASTSKEADWVPVQNNSMFYK